MNYQFSVKTKQVTKFCTHSSRITCARRGVEVHVAGFTGSGDQDSIPGLPSPLVGSLMVKRLKTSSNDPVPVFGLLGTLKIPSCTWCWVPGRSKFEYWTTVRHYIADIRIAECNVKPQPTNHRVTCACKILNREYKF